jgi:mRNA interferase MazF
MPPPRSVSKSRPALIVSVDDIVTGEETELFVVVPLSSSRKASGLRPSVPGAAGSDRASVAVCRGVRAIARTRLLRSLGKVDPPTMRAVEVALALLLGLPGVYGATET